MTVQVLLCEETVSLLGIRQFFKLVGDTPTDSVGSRTSVGSVINGASSSTADAAAAAAALCSSTDVPAAAVQQPQHQDGVKAGPVREQPEPQLSIAEQQQLLVLKVEALLQLLSAVSFHQVRWPVQQQQVQQQLQQRNSFAHWNSSRNCAS